MSSSMAEALRRAGLAGELAVSEIEAARMDRWRREARKNAARGLQRADADARAAAVELRRHRAEARRRAGSVAAVAPVPAPSSATSAPRRAYDPAGRYAPGEEIYHPGLGPGRVVALVDRRRVEAVFGEEKVLLAVAG